MPNITVEGPPIPDIEKKRKLVRTITQVATEVYGLPAQAIVVTIRENSPENVAIGGNLLSDQKKAENHRVIIPGDSPNTLLLEG